jgi:transcriptional regulator with XRE-family HTH domain
MRKRNRKALTKGLFMTNVLLRAARQQRGWNQQQLADFAVLSLSTIERAERGASIRVDSIQRLCACLGKTPEQLGLLREAQQESDSDDMNRRQTLQVLGTGTALLVGRPLTNLPLQELEHFFTRKMARLQTWIIEELEDGTRLRWQLYYTSRNTLTEDGLSNQIMKLEVLADDGGKDRTRICQILAQNYQLAGSLARDQFRYHEAERSFRRAQYVASEANLPDLLSSALARHALAFLRQERIDKALKLYRQAYDAAKHAEPHTQAYVLSGLAEAEARTGHTSECYRLLDQAEHLLDRVQTLPLEEDFAFVQLSLQSLQDVRGECFVILGEPLKGLDYLRAAESKLDQKMSRNHCRLLMQQAEAFLAAGQPDQCVQHALQGLHLARQLESNSNIHWSREIHTKLRQSKWKHEPVVGQLQMALN